MLKDTGRQQCSHFAKLSQNDRIGIFLDYPFQCGRTTTEALLSTLPIIGDEPAFVRTTESIANLVTIGESRLWRREFILHWGDRNSAQIPRTHGVQDRLCSKQRKFGGWGFFHEGSVRKCSHVCIKMHSYLFYAIKWIWCDTETVLLLLSPHREGSSFAPVWNQLFVGESCFSTELCQRTTGRPPVGESQNKLEKVGIFPKK